MKTHKTIVATALAALMTTVFAADAFAIEGNKKRGRVYYRMVCTACHVDATGSAIAPSAKAMAEWGAYLDADKHAASGKANNSVRYHMSKEFRASIQDSNKAAKKFLKLPNEQLIADVRAFVISGAKDSDTPASCN